MKKIYALLLALFLCALCMGMAACGEEEDAGAPQNWTYTVNADNETCSVSYQSKSSDATGELSVEIPRHVNGYLVTAIADDAFRDCTRLVSITIPNSVTTIGSCAFAGCSALKYVNIPDSVTTIGGAAFANCTSLSGIMLSSSLKSVGGTAFNGCRILNNVHISSMDAWCGISFQSNTSNPLHNGARLYVNGALVTDLVIPDSVTSISDFAFLGCEELTSVTVHEGLKSIGEGAFQDCKKIVSVYTPSMTAWLGISFENSFSTPLRSSGTLYSDGRPVTEAVIPDGVERVGAYAFYSYASLTSVSIPDSVLSIGDSAFYGCSKLTDIYIPKSVESIEQSAFSYLRALTSITVDPENPIYHGAGNCLIETASKTLLIGCNQSVLPNDGSITTIGSSAFHNCPSIASVVIPDGVITIEDSAFYGCSKLASVVISDSVITIEARAFDSCYLLKSVTMGSSVQRIGDYAFDNCSLTSLILPLSLTEIGMHAFDDSLKTIYYCGGKSDWSSNVTVKSNVYDQTPTGRTIYYYSPDRPTSLYAGNYWRFVDGEPTKWVLYQ